MTKQAAFARWQSANEAAADANARATTLLETAACGETAKDREAALRALPKALDAARAAVELSFDAGRIYEETPGSRLPRSHHKAKDQSAQHS
jgi:hypothetical protein